MSVIDVSLFLYRPFSKFPYLPSTDPNAHNLAKADAESSVEIILHCLLADRCRFRLRRAEYSQMFFYCPYMTRFLCSFVNGLTEDRYLSIYVVIFERIVTPLVTSQLSVVYSVAMVLRSSKSGFGWFGLTFTNILNIVSPGESGSLAQGSHHQ